MRRIFIILMLSYISTGAISLNAQKIWTLSECIQYALDHNIQIKQQGLNTQLADDRLTQSYYDLLPNLNGGIGGSYSTGRSVDPYTYEFTENNVSSMNFSVASSVTLFSGFQKMNSIQANKYALMASLSDHDRLKNDISLAVITSYLNILYAKELVMIRKEQTNLTRDQVNRTLQLFDAGSVPKGSLLEVKAQLATEETQLVQSENQLNMAYLNLTQLMEWKEGDDFEIADPDVNQLDEGILKLSVGSIYEQAVQRLPQVRSAEFRLKSAHSNYRVALGSFYPRLSASASLYSGYSNNRSKAAIDLIQMGAQPIGYLNADTVYSFPYLSPQVSYSDYPFQDQFRDNAYRSLSLSLSIPIFNNYQLRQAVKASKITFIQSELEVENVKNQLFKEIQQAWSDAIAAMNRFESAQKSLLASEESFSYIQQRFDAGLLSSLEYNTSKNQLTRIQSELLQSKYEYLFKIGILEYFLGSGME
jgi:outer membrane protein